MDEFILEIGNRELKVKIRNLAERANADVLVSYGDTLVFATCVMAKEEKAGLGFFPLTVDYEEKYYAAGKIQGPRYIKRESRPSDEAIVNARLIDRAIRPRFPKNLNREIQVIITVLSWDEKNDPDVVSLIAASTALLISDIPWQGPVAAVRIGKVNEEFILNPIYEEREKSKMDFMLAGIQTNGKFLINMLEGGFDEIEENSILGAFEFAQKDLERLIQFQENIASKIGKEKMKTEESPRDPELEREIREFLGQKSLLEKALFKQKERMEEVNKLKNDLSFFIEGKYPGEGKKKYAEIFFENEINKSIHENVIQKGKRPDGRAIDEIRNIGAEVGLLPRTHGSALFTRGQTKSLSILTLGAPGDQQLLEGMEIVGKKRFMHHYNFPPYSVGEIRPMRGPGRRDIGHGMLVEKALLPLIPSFDEFPYTMRVVSEILSSNGSTSMAAVSSSSLALMDAGVPIKRAATGISLGLIFVNEADYKVLTDIQGPEDFHGDMDFKVAGTKEGVTAIQMDVKTSGITKKIFQEALERGKKARLQILQEMEKVLEKPREKLSPFAPRILTLKINPEKIREVIGPGGRTIHGITEETGAFIDIQQDGLIIVTAESEEPAKEAIAWIKNLTREVEIGEVFQGKVKKVVDFGAFVEILPGQEGLIHISNLGIQRGKEVRDVLGVGTILSVKVINIDEQGRISLTLAKTHSRAE